jgi:SAM-dependent methyltransferase/uncharacterized protein YbaR (Trm112 family)
MKNWAAGAFRDPRSDYLGALSFESFQNDGDEVIEGVFRCVDGHWFPVVDGVPCFLGGQLRPDFSRFAVRHGLPQSEVGAGRLEVSEQAITNKTFSDKWTRFKQYGLDTASSGFLQDWYCKKLGVETIEDLKAFYREKESILEVGPGSGFNTRFIAEHSRGQVFALDISDAAFTTQGNTRHLPNCTTVQADLMEAPFPDESFDFVIADGVLHHTPNTRDAVRALYRKVRPGGQFFFYVYRKMGAARYFCDGYLREQFTRLSPEECYAACEGLTELGRELSRLNARITLTKGVPELGIPPGAHDVQRLLYYNFLKCFWNDAFDHETNNMVNFDWYHPHNAWQHTQDEVKGWLEEFGVREASFNDANPNGISVLLTKPE